MRTRAVRLYGKEDLRLGEFELPSIQDDEILGRVVTDSLCMSTYKAVVQGTGHIRVPPDIAEKPIILGHEFAGEIIKVGKRWQGVYREGGRFSVQPNMNYLGKRYAPGYSFPFFGGDATYIILPKEVMEGGFLLEYEGDAFFKASLAEPVSCIVAALRASYHIRGGDGAHERGIRPGGSMAILAGAGPMGLGAIDLVLHGDTRPSRLVVIDIDQGRLDRAKSILPPEEAAKEGITLTYANTACISDPAGSLRSFSASGKGFDDVLVFAPVKPVVELGDAILGRDGCLNFFAGPTDPTFSANWNFYNVHYAGTHVVGTSGGNTADMIESLRLMGEGRINPAVMVTHIGGLDSAASATLSLPKIPGGKKLIYTGIDLELTALDDLATKGETDPVFRQIDQKVRAHRGLWNAEAEALLLEHRGRK